MNAIKFRKMGMDIRDKEYKGDIGNHRIRAEFEYNGVDYLVEVMAHNTVRRKHATTGEPLKHTKWTSDADGIYIEIYAMYQEVLQGSGGGYFMHPTEKQIYSVTIDDHTAHTQKILLMLINGAIKTEFNAFELK